MQCGVETMNDCERSPGRQGLRVNFTEKGEVKERREKFLTAKYGSHQMSLIRKRLAVEMWLYDELQVKSNVIKHTKFILTRVLLFLFIEAVRSTCKSITQTNE